MSLLFSDGLDSGLIKYARTVGTVNWNPTGGVYGGGCIELPSGGANANYVDILPYPVSYVDTSNPVSRISFWMKISASITTNSGFLVCSNNLGTGGIWSFTTVDTDGRIGFYTMSTNSSSPATFLLRPTTYSRIDDNKWHHIELGLKWTNSTFASYFELSVDGRLILNSSVNDGVTGAGISDPAIVNYFSLRNMQSATVSYDDIMIWNQYNTNDNFANSRIGPTRIFTLRPDADTAQANSTPSSGSDRYLMINEPTLNTANYTTLSIGNKDIYTMSNISNVSGGVVYGALATIYFSSSLPGYIANARPIIVSNGVNLIGNTSTMVTTSTNEIVLRFNKDFGRSNVFWTEATINDLQVGFENPG